MELSSKTNRIEVFKTNVNDEITAFDIIKRLKQTFPDLKINFDLDDCDKILRVEARKENLELNKIIEIVKKQGFSIEILQ